MADQKINEHHKREFKIERHDIRLAFANWIDEMRTELHPDEHDKLPSVDSYTELFIKHLPNKCKL